MNTWAILCLAMYLASPWMFLEYAAEYQNMRRKWTWPFPWWFVVLTFVAWPIIVPVACYANRRKVEAASKRG